MSRAAAVSISRPTITPRLSRRPRKPALALVPKSVTYSKDELLQRFAPLVRHVVERVASTLPRNVDLAAYRIVQESLTNVARHAHPPEAVVRLHADNGSLTIEVLDDGTTSPGDVGVPSGGNGIAGMRERAASVGGHLSAGPRPGRGFAVRAELPLGDPA